MYNLAALVAANLALYKLGADTAWGIHEEWTGDKLPEGRKVHGSFEGVNSFAKMLEVAAGLRLNAWDTRDFSPAGMPNEAKYAAGYGRGSVRQIRELAQLSGMDYGDYLMRLNLSKGHTYPINIPERLHGVEAVDLVSGRRGELREDIKLKPRTTRIFYIGNQ